MGRGSGDPWQSTKNPVKYIVRYAFVATIHAKQNAVDAEARGNFVGLERNSRPLFRIPSSIPA